jgi:hypothetical protein
VRVEGDLDLGTHEPLLDGLARGLALAEDVLIVDLAACHFLSSRSFRAIEDAADFLHARGGRLEELDLLPPSPSSEPSSATGAPSGCSARRTVRSCDAARPLTASATLT